MNERTKKKEWFKCLKTHTLLAVLFSILALILYGSLAFHNNIWYDESYQMALNKHNVIEIIRLAAYDFHPPLYDIMLHIFTGIFGDSLVVCRFFSIFSLIGLIILAFYPVRRAFGIKASVVFSFFLVTFPCLFYSALEIRMYGWAAFFTMAACIYGYLAVTKPSKKNFILLAVYAFCGMYTHIYSLIGIFFCYAVLFFYTLAPKRRKLLPKILICGSINALLFLPWLFVQLHQVQIALNNYWRNSLTVGRCIDAIFTFMFGEYNILRASAVCIIFWLLIVWAIWKLRKRMEQDSEFGFGILYLGLVPAATMAFLIAYVQLVLPAYANRYTIPTMPVFLLFFAVLVANANLKKVLLAAMGVLMAGNMALGYREEFRTAYEDPFGLEEIVDILERAGENGEVYLVHLHEWPLGCFYYYLPELEHTVCDDTYTVLNTYDVFSKDMIKLDNLEELQNYTDTFYFISFANATNDPITDMLSSDEWSFEKAADCQYRYDGSHYYLMKVTKK